VKTTFQKHRCVASDLQDGDARPLSGRRTIVRGSNNVTAAQMTTRATAPRANRSFGLALRQPFKKFFHILGDSFTLR
jgi:hypothetical protein